MLGACDPQWFQTRTKGIQHAWKTHQMRFAKVIVNEHENLDKKFSLPIPAIKQQNPSLLSLFPFFAPSCTSPYQNKQEIIN